MKDPNCKCHEIVKTINEKYPDCDWNCDICCKEWYERSKSLVDNKIKFRDFADENYACTCPTCGQWICGWCV